MALRRLEGFDGLNSYAELITLRGAIETLASGTGMSYSSTGGRNGNGAVSHTVTGSTSLRSLRFKGPSGTGFLASDAGVVGVAFKIKRGIYNPASATTPIPLLTLLDASNAEVGTINLYKTSDVWYVAYYTTSVVRFNAQFPGDAVDEYFPADDRWYYLEVKISDFTTTAASVVTIRINGLTIGTSGSVITSAGPTSFSSVEVNRGRGTGSSQSASLVTGQEIWYDDLYWLDSTHGEHTDFLGDTRIDYVPAGAEGFHTGSTPLSGSDRALMVDDVPSDDDSTYNTLEGVSTRDTFTLAALARSPIAVIAVQPHATIRDAGTVPRFLNICSRWSSTDYDMTATASYMVTPGSTYVGLWCGDSSDNIICNPAGGRWTEADLATAEFGIYVHS